MACWHDLVVGLFINRYECGVAIWQGINRSETPSAQVFDQMKPVDHLHGLGGIRMKLSIHSRHKFNSFVLLAQALPQYLCCGLSFACGLGHQTFCGSTGPLEKAA